MIAAIEIVGMIWMDQTEFSRRLRRLADTGACDEGASVDDYTRILGGLGLAYVIRRIQAFALGGVMAFGSFVALQAAALSSTVAIWGLAIMLVGASCIAVRSCSYWTPAGALRDGLLTLSRYPLNDLGAFIRNQRTDLNTVNNTLLSDLCVQLAMDRRRPKVLHSNDQGIR